MKRRALWQLGLAYTLPELGHSAPSTTPAAAVPTPPVSPALAALALAEKAMGSTTLGALQFTASGTGALVGQSFEPGKPWPRTKLRGYALLADYTHQALREETVASRLEATGGGSLPPLGAGEQRNTTFLREGRAWNMLGPFPLPTPWLVAERQHALWTTPHGVLHAARRNAASLRLSGRTLSFRAPGLFDATVLFNTAWQVAEIQTVLDHPFAGDTTVRTRFADYRQWSGQPSAIPFPARIQQDWGGFATQDLQVQRVDVNPTFVITIPPAAADGQEQVGTEPLADGIWLLHGAAHHSVVIEMKDHVLLVDSPLSPARAEAVAATVKKLVPDKPIAMVIHTHHHFDTSAGVRTAAAWGASILTAEPNRAYVERLLTAPHRIQPDALSRATARPKCIGVNGKSVLTDGTRSVEIHALQGIQHARGLLMVYLPLEKLLVQVDAYTPGPPFSAPPATPQPAHLNLLANIERLKLDVERIVPLRGRVVPAAELLRAVGRAT
jgi:glyoxylase-like metal-dependent hydrolase (beta-lactamase superfamily II)